MEGYRVGEDSASYMAGLQGSKGLGRRIEYGKEAQCIGRMGHGGTVQSGLQRGSGYGGDGDRDYGRDGPGESVVSEPLRETILWLPCPV